MSIEIGLNKDTAQLVATLLAAVGFGFGLIQYYRSAKLRRAEWLHTLFEEFYGAARYKQVRLLLDNDDESTYESLERELTGALESELVDYLNFLEFIGGLWKLGQLTLPEIEILFRYWLEEVAKKNWLLNYIRRYGFENLVALLRALDLVKN